jgi:hypothetical protein
MNLSLITDCFNGTNLRTSGAINTAFINPMSSHHRSPLDFKVELKTYQKYWVMQLFEGTLFFKRTMFAKSCGNRTKIENKCD